LKTLIVDDERHAREAIRMLVDWESLGIDTILEAENVTAAINLIEREHPEIIFTDMMMPVKDGIELLSWIAEKSVQSKIIVVSGYKDFHFVRNTVKYGGLDYLLKPIDMDQLQEITRKAVHQWRVEEKKRGQMMERETKVNKIRLLYWDQFFSKLLYESHFDEYARSELLKEYQLTRLPSKVQVVVVDTVWNHPKLLNKLSNNPDLLYFVLHNISNEYLAKEKAGVAFQNLNRKGITLLIWKCEWIYSLLERINEGLLQTFGIQVHFGVGELCNFPDDLAVSSEQAYSALRDRDLRNKETRIHYSPPVIANSLNISFSRFEHHIHLAICSGISERIQEVLSQWFEGIDKMNGVPVRFYELLWKEFISFASRWNTEYLEDEIHLYWPEPYFIPLDPEGNFSTILWKERMISICQLLSKTFVGKQPKDRHVVYDIAQFLETNYKEEANLQEVANLFSLSKEHISRKFKQELKVTLSDYIVSVRIKHAKALLSNPHLKICQIAEMVGYQDEKYFSKVFKKWEGVTPMKYRKTAQPSSPTL
jgi:two-component system response regulator YesN